MLLEVEEIHTFYGSGQVLFGVSVTVRSGEVVCLLGRNGAGKSTALKSIMGITRPASGSIRFKGEEIIGKPAFRIARLGIGYLPDTLDIFSDLSVQENMEVARRRLKGGAEEWTVDRIYPLFPVLKARHKTRAQFLSGGEQKMLGIARALMINPDLLLLDEPSEGLAPILRRELIGQIVKLNAEGSSILLTEQNLKLALAVSQITYIIESGIICWKGSTHEVLADEKTIQKHLAV